KGKQKTDAPKRHGASGTPMIFHAVVPIQKTKIYSPCIDIAHKTAFCIIEDAFRLVKWDYSLFSGKKPCTQQMLCHGFFPIILFCEI
ncbi:MAG: hypothetical protein IJL96_05265, partial [Clostridia bacterium]|nr:hypothetical protein [Clostridia bacterium]